MSNLEERQTPNDAVSQISRAELANLLVVSHEAKIQEDILALADKESELDSWLTEAHREAYQTFWERLRQPSMEARETWIAAVAGVPFTEVLSEGSNAPHPDNLNYSSTSAWVKRSVYSGREKTFASVFQQKLQEAFPQGYPHSHDATGTMPESLWINLKVRNCVGGESYISLPFPTEIPDLVFPEGYMEKRAEYLQVSKEKQNLERTVAEDNQPRLQRQALATLTSHALSEASITGLPALNIKPGYMLVDALESGAEDQATGGNVLDSLLDD